MTTEEKIRFIADSYGYDAQSRQCIEEMAELTQAINKFWRKELKCGNRQLLILNSPFYGDTARNLKEELADVAIMVAQMEHLLHTDLSDIVEEKLDRQIRRIQEGRDE